MMFHDDGTGILNLPSHCDKSENYPVNYHNYGTGILNLPSHCDIEFHDCGILW